MAVNDKDIKKLNRADLLELLIAQSEEMEKLREKLGKAEKELADRRIVLANCGSIAEASLHLNGIFQSAQKAADEYLENIKLHSQTKYELFSRAEAEANELSERMLADTRRKCRMMEEETRKNCEEMTRCAKKASEEYWNSISAKKEGQKVQDTGVKDEK